MLLVSAWALSSWILLPSKTWGVLLSTIPTAVSTTNRTNSVNYILKQTHEPLFRKDDGQNFNSTLLRMWSRSVDSSRYEFCPDTSLSFGSGQKFTLDYFGDYIARMTARYSSAAKVVKENNGCFNVEFASRQPGYLDFLSLYDNAPSIERTKSIEDGLGVYSVEAIEKARIVLKRKAHVRNGYSSIVFYSRSGVSAEEMRGLGISDYNQISSFDVPDWVAKEYLGFDNLKLKSEALVINTEDKDLRDIVYNCFDVRRFRAAFLPSKHDFRDVRTLLPLGVPGAEAGLPEQICSERLKKKAQGRSLVFCNWTNDNYETLKKFFREIYGKTGLKVKLVNYEASELASLLYKKPRVYDLVVVMVGATRAEYKGFFDPFLGDNSVLSYKLEKTKNDYKKLLHEMDPQKKADISKDVAEGLAGNHSVLTLYQGYDPIYYPKEIKNIVVGRDFMEYPEVGDFRW